MSLSESKSKIIEDLLDAGNQCLIRFSNRNELASEHDKRVSLLYQCFESFFLHGLKENQHMFNLTRKMISNSLSNSPKNFSQFVSSKDHHLGFWQFVTFFLSKHEVERFSHLRHVKTSLGRGRSWLRSSLNEHTLERYLKAMLENGGTIVKQFYEEDAAIRDAGKQSEILDLVSKLNSVLFASTIDNPNLSSSFSNSHPAKGRQPSAKQPTDLVDQQQEDNKPTTATDSNRPLPNQSRSSAMQSIAENEERTSLNSNSLSRTNSSKLDLNLPLELSRNSSYSSNYQQDDANLEDKSDDEPNEPIVSNVLLTPIGNYSVTDQFMTTNYDEEEKVSDFSNQSCNTSCSSTPAFHSKELANFERTKRLFDKEFESIHSKQNSTRLLESRQFPGDHQANEDSGESSGRRPLFATDPEQLELEDRIGKLESQNKELKSENKLLKIQLMKYIDAISLLQSSDRDAILKCANTATTTRDSIEECDLSVLSEQISERQTSLLSKNNHPHRPQQSQQPPQFSVNAYLNYRDSIEYEAKLVQVAEMHGEIVEYNDRLHRVLMQKDATIKRLKDQLIELRGPLPDTIQSDEDEIVSIASDSEHQSLQFSSILTQNLKPLINIWIPSAFLADQKQTYQNSYLSADQQRSNKVSSHHVYQIYIRIKDDEWNCYRRYSQFHAIHQILKKKYQQISALEFPPKKTIGNRHAKVVQERRKKLEVYLRQAINILQNDNNIYDRNSLVEVLPFLSEKYVSHSNKANDTSARNVINDANLGEGIVQQQDYHGL